MVTKWGDVDQRILGEAIPPDHAGIQKTTFYNCPFPTPTLYITYRKQHCLDPKHGLFRKVIRRDLRLTKLNCLQKLQAIEEGTIQ
jgi:hypothetical protein